MSQSNVALLSLYFKFFYGVDLNGRRKFYGDFMAKYLSYCEGCKLDCKDGLLDLNNSPHKVFSFDDYLVIDWWCAEHQALLHQKI